MASVDTHPKRFEYQPLSNPAGEIRLLSITASPAPEELRFDISVCPLDAASSYHAISYVWGTPGRRRSIWINGHECPVGENCWYALWQASRTNLDIGSYVWIDAVCINQEDISEKGSQVAMMGAIFASAVCVLACIGPHDNDSEFLFANAPDDHYLYRKRQARPPVRDDWQLMRDGRADFWRQTFRHKDDGRAHSSIAAVAKRPYFHRLWVVQEVNLARKADLCCGEHRMDLTALVHMAWHGCYSPHYQHVDYHAMFKLAQITNWVPNLGESGLWHCLKTYGERLCTDLHDKIYAIMELWSWAPGVDPITPRYDCSLPELLVETMVKTSSTASQDCVDVIEQLLNTLRLRNGEHDFLDVQLPRHDYEGRAGRGTSDTFAQLHHRIDIVSGHVLSRGNNILEFSNHSSQFARFRRVRFDPMRRLPTSEFSLLYGAGSLRSKAIFLASPLVEPGDFLVRIIDTLEGYYIIARQSGARLQMISHAFLVTGPKPTASADIRLKEGDSGPREWHAVLHVLDLIHIVHTQCDVLCVDRSAISRCQATLNESRMRTTTTSLL